MNCANFAKGVILASLFELSKLGIDAENEAFNILLDALLELREEAQSE